MPPGEGALLSGCYSSTWLRDSMQSRCAYGSVVMGKSRYRYRELPMKISIELDRSDLRVLAAIFLLLFPDYEALRA